MVKSIQDLKKLIKDGMVLVSDAEQIRIHRAANNILRIHGRLVSWPDLQDILANGTYDLMSKDGKKIVDGSARGWGGRRIAGPGKKLGRKAKDPEKKKRSMSFSLSYETRDKLDELCRIHGKKRSQIIEMLINGEI